MMKNNYAGGGLGKNGNGIVEPVHAVKKTMLGDGDTGNLNNTKRDSNENTSHPWPKGTTLIAGSSILSGIREGRLKNCKVRAFSGACISDMYDYLTPLLKKKPTNIILQVGTNDAPFKSSDQIVQDLMALKSNIISLLPGVKVYFSCPTLRFDNGLANSVCREVSEKLRVSTEDVIVNDNIDRGCLGHKGLHLNEKGSGRLAINFISLMRRL